MTIAIVVYILLVTIPLVGAAMLAEKLCRLWSLPVRWTWIVTALLIALIGGRTITHPLAAPQSHASITATVNVASSTPIVATNITSIQTVAAQLISFPRTVAANVAHAAGPLATLPLAILWALMSAVVIALICVVYTRMERSRRDWNIVDFAGHRVRVAPHAGPAVIGLFNPEIVVPRWVLDAQPEESHLILMHEMEHTAARDPLLLAAMWALVALFPWHPGAWYCLARTRLAIELDCDARVVGRGASLKSYAQLLVNQARLRLGAPMHLWLGATSLLEPSSHLERRLRAMIVPDSSASARRSIPRYLRTFGYAAIVSTIAIVACESHVPTAADISGLDAASAEKNAGQLQIIDANGRLPAYYVDDVLVTGRVAQALPPDSIATMSIVRAHKAGEQSQIRIIKVGSVLTATLDPSMRTGSAVVGGSSVDTITLKPFMRTGSAVAGRSSDTAAHTVVLRGVPSDGDASPMLFINGVAASAAEYKALDPKTIVSIEVVKGPAAAAQEAQYTRAKNGIIYLTVKKP